MTFLFLLRLVIDLTLAEEQGNAPDARKAHQRENHPGNHGFGAAGDPGHEVETEDAHAAPVQRADYHKDKGYFVHDHGKQLPFVWCPLSKSSAVTGFLIGSIPAVNKIMQKS